MQIMHALEIPVLSAPRRIWVAGKRERGKHFYQMRLTNSSGAVLAHAGGDLLQHAREIAMLLSAGATREIVCNFKTVE